MVSFSQYFEGKNESTDTCLCPVNKKGVVMGVFLFGG